MWASFRRKRWIIAVCGILAFGGTVLAWHWTTESKSVADPGDTAQVALGRTIYAENCASCHGVNLQGQPDWRLRKPDGRLPAPPHDETGHTWHHPDEHLFRMTKLGLKPPLAPEGYKSDMPAFEGKLTDDQIWVVLAFIKSTWSQRILARQNGRNRRANK